MGIRGGGDGNGAGFVRIVRGRTARLATNEVWGHAIIVAIFAVVLPLRMRSAVEAVIPELFPVWKRIEMVLLAARMVVLVIAGVRALRAG